MACDPTFWAVITHKFHVYYIHHLLIRTDCLTSIISACHRAHGCASCAGSLVGHMIMVNVCVGYTCSRNSITNIIPTEALLFWHVLLNDIYISLSCVLNSLNSWSCWFWQETNEKSEQKKNLLPQDLMESWLINPFEESYVTGVISTQYFIRCEIWRSFQTCEVHKNSMSKFLTWSIRTVPKARKYSSNNYITSPPHVKLVQY